MNYRATGVGWGAAEYSPFYAIEKGAVLQEARCFNDPHIDPRRCQQVGISLRVEHDVDLSAEAAIGPTQTPV